MPLKTMHAYIGAALVFLSIGANSQNLAADSINDFAHDIYKDLLESENGNFILSPISVSTLLAMLEVGAQGNTNQQLRKALHYPPLQNSPNFGQETYSSIIQGLKFRTRPSRNVLEFGSHVYMSPNIDLTSQYLDYISQAFLAEAQMVDFRNSDFVAQTINDWVKVATKGKITSLIDSGSISKDTQLILANAMYFRGLWEKRFDVNSTTNEEFVTDPNISGRRVYSTDQKSIKIVPMMKQVDRFVASSDSKMGAKWVHLPFDKDEFSMVLVIPSDDRGINSLARRLTKENLEKIMQTKTLKNVVLGLPKFKISTQLSLVDSIKRIGVQDIFSPAANFQSISNNRVYVNQILHKAQMEVNEEGSSAAAATGVLVNTLSLAQPDEFTFYVNQPFLFFIIKKNPTIPLFFGRVTNP